MHFKSEHLKIKYTFALGYLYKNLLIKINLLLKSIDYLLYFLLLILFSIKSEISISLSSFSVIFFGFTKALRVGRGRLSSSRIELPRLVLLPPKLAFCMGVARTSTPPTMVVDSFGFLFVNCDSIVCFNSAIFGLVRVEI